MVLAQADFHMCAMAVRENGRDREISPNGLSNNLPDSVKDRELAKLDQATEISIACMN